MKFSIFVSVAITLPLLVSAFSETTSKSLKAIAQRDTVSEILTAIEDATTCSSCNALLLVLQALAHTGNDNFVSVITTICEDVTSEGDDVCTGAIGLEGPILAHDLRVMTIDTRTSQLFCLTIFGLCQWPDIEEYTVNMTTKPDTSRPAVSGKTPLQVVHISDIHVDLSYETGASYNCTENICCRSYTAGEAVGVTDYPAGEYGNVNCDSPLSLEESMYTAVESLVPNRTFTIFTGDVVEGAVWAVTDEEVANDLTDAYNRMQGLGQTYGVVGNHDSCPVNSFPPAAVDTTTSSQWVYNNLSAEWDSWIGSTAAEEVENTFGCYSVVDSATGLRLISLNTNFWYKQNFWMYEATMERDPSGILAWLVSELETAETAGERVWLMGHMPMGSSDTFHDASQYFDQIVQRFDATISAMFFGHTHKDEFQISYSNYTAQGFSTASMVSYIAPALTPTSGNPTFRVYSVDSETFAILDYSVYYTNISSPTYQSGPTWSLLYSVKETYGSLLSPPLTDASAELTPAFWHNLTELFEDDDNTFQEYYARKSRDYDLSTCDTDCKTAEICQLRAAQSQYNCGTVSPGVSFKRSVENATTVLEQSSECDGSAIVPIMKVIGASGIDTIEAALVNVLGEDWLNTQVNGTVNGIVSSGI